MILSTMRTMMFGIALVAGMTALSGCTSTPTQRNAAEYVDDATISTKVKAAFIGDADVSLSDIEVETYRGVVQLSGFADSEMEADRATQLAQNVHGVKDVKNDIRLKQ